MKTFNERVLWNTLYIQLEIIASLFIYLFDESKMFYFLRCRPVVRKLVSQLGGTHLARALLNEFTRFLDTVKVSLLLILF